jgi:hypothetical protein
VKVYGGVDVWIRFTPLPLYLQGKSPGTHWIGGWVSRRAGLDGMKLKSLTVRRLELLPLGRLARSQSLYRLRYRGSALISCSWLSA